MRTPVPVTALIALLGYLAVASVPCGPLRPVPTAGEDWATHSVAHREAHHATPATDAADHHAHAAGHDARVSDRPAADEPATLALRAPCPCGCSEHGRPGASSWNARLAPALASRAQRPVEQPPSWRFAATAERAPDPPWSSPEPIPI